MTNRLSRPKHVLFDYRFPGTALLGALTVGFVSVFGSLEAQVAMLGTWLSIFSGLVIAQIQGFEQSKLAFRNLLAVAGFIPSWTERPELLKDYLKISQSLASISAHADPVLIQLVNNKLDTLTDQIQALAQGEITFASTEAWRMTYEQLLRRKGARTYQPVAWFKSTEYWQDEPGRMSALTKQTSSSLNPSIEGRISSTTIAPLQGSDGICAWQSERVGLLDTRSSLLVRCART